MFKVADLYLLAPEFSLVLLALVVMGQMSAALLLEHFGWLGAVRHPVTWVRILGVLLIVAGAALVRFF